jgi:hypothetical protein
LRCGYLAKSEAAEIDQAYEQILAELVRMTERPEDWVVGANRSPRVTVSPRRRVISRSPRHGGDAVKDPS